jgi:hypothetical protein
MTNATADFLDTKYLRWQASVQLDDVQALFGGVRLRVGGSGQGQLERVVQGGQITSRRIFLNPRQVEQFWQLCIAHDFLTIQPDERPGRPDEARPRITLRNFRGEEHSVAKWAGVQDARFEAIYQALLDFVAQAEAPPKATPKRRPAWPKWLLVGGMIVLALGLIWPARLLALRIAGPGVTEDLFRLIPPLGLILIAVPLCAGLLLLIELRADRWRRIFWRDTSLIVFVIGMVYVISLCLIPSLLISAGLNRWGAVAEGTIESRTVSTRLDYSGDTPTPETVYTVEYSFTSADGTIHTASTSVSRRFYESLAVGDRVTVSYVPGFPRLSGLEVEADAVGRADWLFTIELTLLFWLIGIGIGTHGGRLLVRSYRAAQR